MTTESKPSGSPTASAAQPSRRFANLMIDQAFKLVFGSPGNKHLLIQLIECLIPGLRLEDISLLNTEVPGFFIGDKRNVYDIYCRSASGQNFVCEMQIRNQDYFADRMLFYSTFPIREQLLSPTEEQRLREGLPADEIKTYRLNPVYMISIVNFEIDGEDPGSLRDGLLSSYSIRNDNGENILTDSLHFIYLQLARLPYGAGEADRCRTLLEKLAFTFKHSMALEERPESFEEEFLRNVFHAAEIANMKPQEATEYQKAMTTEIDIRAQIAYAARVAAEQAREEARAEALAEGRAEGISEGESKTSMEIARRMLSRGTPVEHISEDTGLTIEQVEAMRKG